MRRGSTKPLGFTLIELLVVIAIIAILAAILFPVFAKAREKARQTSCLSNQKQIALGLLMYAQDYDEKIPYPFWGWGTPPYTWRVVIDPYIKNTQIYQCPSDSTAYWLPVQGSYALNCNFFNFLNIPGQEWTLSPSIGQIVCPSQTLLTSELANGDWPILPWNVAFRHNEGANVSFVDGHVKWMKTNALVVPAWGWWTWYGGDK